MSVWGSLVRVTLVLALLCGTQPASAEETIEAQRFAFAATPGYDGYALTAGEIAMSLRARALWNAGDQGQAIALLDEWIARYPLSITGHRMLSEFDRKLSAGASDDPERARLEQASEAHRATLVGLIVSIAHGTQCASIEDHCKVINIAEENAIIVDAGAKSKPRQDVVSAGPDFYDRIVGRDAHGNERTFFFDITSFYKGPFTGRMETAPRSR